MEYQNKLEIAIAEAVADVLLEGVFQHSGCTVTLMEVRYDDIGSSEAAFMKAAKSAMQSLLANKWRPVGRPQVASAL
jgi:translation elongation factor EF-G